jgi:hypothetical protein
MTTSAARPDPAPDEARTAPVPDEARTARVPGGARASNTWELSFRLWDSYFAIVWVATLVFVLGTAHPAWHVRLAAGGLLLLLIPWYLLVGRPVLTADAPDERRALGYIAGAVLLFLPPGVLVGETRLMTFALIPQCFIALRLRRALTAATVINIAPVAGWAMLWRPSGQDLFFNTVFAVVTLVFSTALGSWIIRIMEQSLERAALIAELDAGRHEIARLSAAHGALAERERFSREILPHSPKGMGGPPPRSRRASPAC